MHDYAPEACEPSPSDRELRDGTTPPLSRLDAVLALLAQHGYKTDVRAAASSLSECGYLSVLPASLRLFYVYASRAQHNDGGDVETCMRERQ